MTDDEQLWEEAYKAVCEGGETYDFDRIAAGFAVKALCQKREREAADKAVDEFKRATWASMSELYDAMFPPVAPEA